MSDEKYFKIIEKIQKLFALAKSPNENEAASALFMAKQLMLKYNIDEMELNKKSEENDIIEIDFKISYSAEEYSLRFAYWLGKAFLVKPIQIKRNIGENKIEFERFIRFIGKKADVAISTFVFSYIMNILDKKSKNFSKKRAIKKDYELGFVTAICYKLEEMEKERIEGMTFYDSHPETALVVTSNALIKRYIDKKYGDKLNDGNETEIKFNIDAFQKGYIEGQKHGIFAGIEEKVDKNEYINYNI